MFVSGMEIRISATGLWRPRVSDIEALESAGGGTALSDAVSC